MVNGFWRFFHLNMQLLKSFHSFHSPSRSSSMLPIMNYDWIKRERNSNIWGSISMSDMRSMKSLKYSLHLSSSSKLKCNCLAISSVFLLSTSSSCRVLCSSLGVVGLNGRVFLNWRASWSRTLTKCPSGFLKSLQSVASKVSWFLHHNGNKREPSIPRDRDNWISCCCCWTSCLE